MEQDLFSKGCLVKLETPVWTARVKIPAKLLLNGDHNDVDPRFIGASKRLVDGDSLHAIETIRSEARSWLYAQSLPFPLEGAVFVPISVIDTVAAKLQGYKERFQEAVAAFAKDYPTLRETARERLGPLYNETDYPESVDDRFDFRWRFLTLGPANQAQLLNPTLVAQARQEFQQLMSRAANAAVTELRVRFADCVEHMVDRLSGDNDGKPKVFRNSLIGNMREFLESFQSLNVMDDQALTALVTRAEAAIEGVDPDELRSDASLRKHVAEQMSQLQTALDGMITDRPGRKIRLAPAAGAAAAEPQTGTTE